MILSPNAIQRVRQAFSFLFILLGVWIAFITPPDGLSPQTMKALGITVWGRRLVDNADRARICYGPAHVRLLGGHEMRSFSDCVRHILHFRVVDHGWGRSPSARWRARRGSSSASPCACCICSRRPSRGRSGASSPRVRSFLRSFQALTQRQRFPRPSR